MTHRQGRAAASITVGFRQNNAGQLQCIIKGLGGIDRILTNHGVNHKQSFGRLNGLMHLLDLIHQGVVDVQTTGRIHNHHISVVLARIHNGIVGNVDGVLIRCRREKIGANFARKSLKLLDSRRAIDIGRHHNHLLLFTLLKVLSQLRHRGGFTRPLQASHQHNRRRLNRQIQCCIGFAHHGDHFTFNNFNELLTGVKRP